MTRITIKTPAIRGVIQLHANENDPTQFIAVGSSYKPMTLEALTLGDAVNTFMQNIHRLQKSDEAKAKSAARSINIKATQQANELARQNSRKRVKHQEQSTDVDIARVS